MGFFKIADKQSPEVVHVKSETSLYTNEIDAVKKDIGKLQGKQVSKSALSSGTPSTPTISNEQVATQPIASEYTRRRMKPKIKTSKEDTLVPCGKMVRNRWLIKGMIGSGGYGEIYYSLDTQTNEHVAVKVEPTKRKGKRSRRIILEQKVLLRLQGRPHAALMFGSGVERNLNYIVLQLLSVNIEELRKQSATKKFTKSTAGRIMQQAIAGIRDIHKIGFLHRDIKPANMCFGVTEASKHRLIIFDFGLARKYLNADGKIRQRRNRAGFRGTLRYVSPRVHKRQEQGPADDLISLFYALIEMVNKHLPWSSVFFADDIKNCKEELVQSDFSELAAKFGEPLRQYGQYVSYLNANEIPDYQKLQEYMKEFAGNAQLSDPYDWEDKDYETIPIIDEPSGLASEKEFLNV